MTTMTAFALAILVMNVLIRSHKYYELRVLIGPWLCIKVFLILMPLCYLKPIKGIYYQVKLILILIFSVLKSILKV